MFRAGGALVGAVAALTRTIPTPRRLSLLHLRCCAAVGPDTAPSTGDRHGVHDGHLRASVPALEEETAAKVAALPDHDV